MTVATRSRRRQRRYPVSQDKTACVEFEYPSPNGEHYRLPVTNLSVSGVSFSIDGHDELAELESGTNVPKAILRVGQCMINSDMVVMHMTPGEASPLICGALLYPDTDEDLLKLKAVIAGMEAVGAE